MAFVGEINPDLGHILALASGSALDHGIEVDDPGLADPALVVGHGGMPRQQATDLPHQPVRVLDGARLGGGDDDVEGVLVVLGQETDRHPEGETLPPKSSFFWKMRTQDRQTISDRLHHARSVRRSGLTSPKS